MRTRIDPRDDRGVALILVVGVSSLLSLLVLTSLTFARNSTDQSHLGQDDQGAIAAAQAGLDDYLYRLNLDDEYVFFDDANPDPNNPAFNAWVPVPGGQSEARFTYDVDISSLGQTGTITVIASGEYRRVVRSVRANIRRDSFLEFLYVTDLETLDPDAYSVLSVRPNGGACPHSTCLTGNAAVTWARNNCTSYRYQRERPDGTNQCREIFWITGDENDGPFHTNDRFRVSGTPAWTETVTSSSPIPPFWTGTGSPQFRGSPPDFRTVRQLPPDNREIRVQADHTINNEGCLFTGPTRIQLQGAQLRVTSPFSTTTGPTCGSYSATNPTNTIPIPGNGVVYVQNRATACTNHPLGLPWTAPSAFGGNVAQRTDDNSYNCRDGDVFLDGTLDGRLTIASENNITVVNDVVRQDRGADSDDMLGLIANNFVQVYHPVDVGTNRNLPTGPFFPERTLQNPTVEAAILSVTHSWMVPYWYVGTPLGDVTVVGAIAQKFRGPVGSFNSNTTPPQPVSGYNKAYEYDRRFRFLNPPHFINPVAAEWRIRQFTELLDHPVTTTN